MKSADSRLLGLMDRHAVAGPDGGSGGVAYRHKDPDLVDGFWRTSATVKTLRLVTVDLTAIMLGGGMPAADHADWRNGSTTCALCRRRPQGNSKAGWLAVFSRRSGLGSC